MVILYRYASTPEPVGSLDGFVDRDATGGHTLDTLHWAVDEGLLTGKDGGRPDPTGTATRIEAAILLICFAERDA